MAIHVLYPVCHLDSLCTIEPLRSSKPVGLCLCLIWNQTHGWTLDDKQLPTFVYVSESSILDLKACSRVQLSKSLIEFILRDSNIVCLWLAWCGHSAVVLPPNQPFEAPNWAIPPVTRELSPVLTNCCTSPPSPTSPVCLPPSFPPHLFIHSLLFNQDSIVLDSIHANNARTTVG